MWRRPPVRGRGRARRARGKGIAVQGSPDGSGDFLEQFLGDLLTGDDAIMRHEILPLRIPTEAGDPVLVEKTHDAVQSPLAIMVENDVSPWHEAGMAGDHRFQAVDEAHLDQLLL